MIVIAAIIGWIVRQVEIAVAAFILGGIAGLGLALMGVAPGVPLWRLTVGLVLVWWSVAVALRLWKQR